MPERRFDDTAECTVSATLGNAFCSKVGRFRNFPEPAGPVPLIFDFQRTTGARSPRRTNQELELGVRRESSLFQRRQQNAAIAIRRTIDAEPPTHPPARTRATPPVAAVPPAEDGIIPNGEQFHLNAASGDGQYLAGAQEFQDGSYAGILFDPVGGYQLTGEMYPTALRADGLAYGFDRFTGTPSTWSPSTGVVPMPNIPEEILFGSASLVSESGKVVVSAATDETNLDARALYLFDDGDWSKLETPAGSIASAAFIDEETGLIGGGLNPSLFDPPTATLWSFDGRLQYVDDLLTPASSILMFGVSSIGPGGVLGASGTDESQAERLAYLLFPVPEPTAAIAIGMAIGCVRRKR